MRYKWLLLLFVLLLLNPLSAWAAADFPISIDGTVILSDVSPIQTDGRVFVPLRAVSEGLDAEVVWQDGTVLIRKAGNEFQLTIGTKAVHKNASADLELEAPPFIRNNRTMVPLDFLTEVFLVKADYVDGKVIITRGSVAKEDKARFFDLALANRFDFLPEMSPGRPPALLDLLFYTYFSKDSYWDYDQITTAEVERVGKDRFGLTEFTHESNKYWRLEGDTYSATGWSWASACFFDLKEINTYMEGAKKVTEIRLDEYTFPEYGFYFMDFNPDPAETYSAPMMYVIDRKGNAIQKGEGVIDAIKSLIVEGDTSYFVRGESKRIKYLGDEKTGDMEFLLVETIP